MRTLNLITFLLLNVFCVTAQTSDSLVLKKAPLSGYLLQNTSGKRVSLNQAIELSKNNEEAQMYFKKAEANFSFGCIVGFAGGALIGYQIGGAIVTGQIANPIYMVAGVGLIGASIPFSVWTNKNLRKAVDLYNKPFRTIPADSTLRSFR